MITSPSSPYASRLWALVVAVLCLTGLAQASVPTGAIITQVYGAGGNSGATYNADYVEIFNPTSSTLTLSNYSIQYASVAGTTIASVTTLPPSITLQPGQYYLIAAAAGSVGAALPTPDSPNAPFAIAATAGKIYLVNSTNKLTAACPATDPSIVDFVAFGSTPNCAYGTAAPAPSATTAIIRANACNITGNNSTDYAARTPTPHNASSTLAPCSNTGSSPLAATALATPSTLYLGNTTLLTATVIPGTLPNSTGIAVTADLSTIGGVTNQPFYDDGTHGDVTAGDNVFSFSATPTATGTFTLPVSVSDAQAQSAAPTIALTVAAAPPTVSIQTIQANKPSTYATQAVTTSGIVIGVKSNGFYIESKNATTNPTTPQGILVYTGSTRLPSYIAIGNEVQVQGTVNTYPAYPSATLTPGTEIDGPQTFTLLTTGNTLPTPITLTAAQDSPAGGIKQFTQYEGSRIAIGSVTTTSGTDASLNEATETNTSNGRFYGVVTGVPRPFREPGVSVTDTLYGTIPSGVTVWDSNPELLYFDSLAFGAPAIDLTSNAILTGVSGVMDFSFGSPEILIDAANRPTVTGLMTAQPVPAQAATEFTAASFNMERFYNDVADADNPGSSVVIVTTAAYQRRLAKASLAIRNVLNFPDIIGAQEIENINVLTDLANKISADALTAGQTDPVYKPYLFLATDGTGINTGVLVKSTRVNTVKAEQFGLTTTFTNAGGNQAVLNDRTPLVMHLGVKRANGAPDYPVTFISVHQRSLINVDDPTSTGATVRLKREAQAEYLARLIQGYQAAGEHVITVGDYNAFEFSDGFVDSLGVTTGKPVPSTQVITPPVANLVTPNLVDLVTLLPAAQRQSYVETGSAQVLDHVVVTSDLVPLETRLVYAHIDADFPLVYQNDATRPERVSDHDPVVAYFTIPPAPAAISLSASTLTFAGQLSGSTSAAQTVTVTNTGFAALTFSSIAVSTTTFAQTNTCGTSLAPSATCTISVTFKPTATGAATGTITITSNASTSPTTIALTGTGTDFTLTTTTQTQTVTNGNTATVSLALTSIGGYTGQVTFACTGLLTGETCTTTPVTLAATGTTTATVTISTTRQVTPNAKATGTTRAANHTATSNGTTRLAGISFAGLTLLALAGSIKRRSLGRYTRLLSLFALLATLGALAGCNDAGVTFNPSGTPSGTGNIGIVATSAGVSHTITVQVVVQ
ncbi:hypothetical protein SAMN05421771_3787 [Granulicella pectinivorans]|uniref:LTD domain-containing protein n=1 Tax=Granulicella pectinivorans TaxID=474950 RepID=A0A1I6MYG3_9BACT|nr:choice-of-anchor D domain-containing protein [Granulicella pectinivorans]SFS20726.1 hypothetical protein SAMN05421771_3787 [Granulicella pectinivorans]